MGLGEATKLCVTIMISEPTKMIPNQTGSGSIKTKTKFQVKNNSQPPGKEKSRRKRVNKKKLNESSLKDEILKLQGELDAKLSQEKDKADQLLEDKKIEDDLLISQYEKDLEEELLQFSSSNIQPIKHVSNRGFFSRRAAHKFNLNLGKVEIPRYSLGIDVLYALFTASFLIFVLWPQQIHPLVPKPTLLKLEEQLVSKMNKDLTNYYKTSICERADDQYEIEACRKRRASELAKIDIALDKHELLIDDFRLYCLIYLMMFFIFLLLAASWASVLRTTVKKRTFKVTSLPAQSHSRINQKTDYANRSKDTLNPRIFNIKITNVFSSGKITTANLHVSAALMAELLHTKTASLGSSPDTVMEKMRYTAASNTTLNLNKYDFLKNQDVIDNTIFMAYLIFQSREKFYESLDFLKTS